MVTILTDREQAVSMTNSSRRMAEEVRSKRECGESRKGGGKPLRGLKKKMAFDLGRKGSRKVVESAACTVTQ